MYAFAYAKERQIQFFVLVHIYFPLYHSCNIYQAFFFSPRSLRSPFIL